MQTRLEEINQILHNEDWKKIDSHSLIMERSELEFKRNKKNINFSLRGKEKYYLAFQCYYFTQNLLKYGYNGFNSATEEEIKEKGICFNKYSINVGYSQYCKDLKRFSSKEEMFGFVIGYNEAVQVAKGKLITQKQVDEEIKKVKGLFKQAQKMVISSQD